MLDEFTLDFLYCTKIASQTFVPLAPYVKLEPARSYLHPGDSIVVDCKSSAEDSTVTWKREGSPRLPSNFRVSDQFMKSQMNHLEQNMLHRFYFGVFFSNKNLSQTKQFLS